MFETETVGPFSVWKLNCRGHGPMAPQWLSPWFKESYILQNLGVVAFENTQKTKTC